MTLAVRKPDRRTAEADERDERTAILLDEREYVRAVRLTGLQIARAVTDGYVDRVFQLAAGLVHGADKRARYLEERAA